MNRRNISLAFALLISLTACKTPGTVGLPPSASPSLEPVTPLAAGPTSSNPEPETTVQSPESNPDQSNQGTADEGICPSGPAVVIAVAPALLDSIRSGLTQFEDDLEQQGFQVIETSTDFATPVELRAALSDLYLSTAQCLVGGYLIGDLPYAYQWFRTEYPNPDIPPAEQEVISFQYYADLDGIFSASEDYTSPGGHQFSYDIHQGDLDWEIWIGILPLYKGDQIQTSQAINRYFEKNHAYRQGGFTIPRAFLGIDEFLRAESQEDHSRFLEMSRSGQYAWTPFSEAPEAQFYFNSPPADMTVEQGYEALSAGEADFTAVSAHGNWQSSGSINIDWVESNPVQTVFFYTGGCSVGNLDQDQNFLSSILYSPTSTVLLAWGSTSESGGMGTNADGFYGHNVAAALTEGRNFGEAILEHVNTPLIAPYSDHRELHYSVQVFLGDPSLTLYP